jgi:hypothetical protein
MTLVRQSRVLAARRQPPSPVAGGRHRQPSTAISRRARTRGALVTFLDRWDRKQPLVIHCFAGISRSTAAAFISACALSPKSDEAAIAMRLRSASRTASPNPRLVALADDFLGRHGRMKAAIAKIGYGDFKGRWFGSSWIDLIFHPPPAGEGSLPTPRSEEQAEGKAAVDGSLADPPPQG